ncbi:MarR family winged helix-turn-helix transcriptional regulator [Actinomadura darangshiensis]|uniref:MarR family winged helix-turn-helix transcriptional regulator n=1 Tax=Actinomadura darangshiensis TaxID=705336 RepID=UPI00140D89F8|nr:MarR family transcriptional regulator [Actinomadura darangshiensis]
MAKTPRRTKSELVDDLVGEFRVSGNQDSAFDGLAAGHLGVNRTDLHCLNIIENSGGLTAGELAAEAGLSTGAVTGVIDRLEEAGYARRVPDPADRRRIKVEVTRRFYVSAGRIWGPMKADWESTLAERFTAEELERAIDFLRTANEIGRRNLKRLREMR